MRKRERGNGRIKGISEKEREAKLVRMNKRVWEKAEGQKEERCGEIRDRSGRPSIIIALDNTGTGRQEREQKSEEEREGKEEEEKVGEGKGENKGYK